MKTKRQGKYLLILEKLKEIVIKHLINLYQIMAGKQNKISFSEYEMEHLYDMARDNMEDECIECQKLKYRIEKFLGIKPKRKS